MTNYLKKKFALSDKGAKDLVKAIVACTLTDMSFMFGRIAIFCSRRVIR